MGEPAVDRDIAADEVIKKHVAYSMIGGAVPVPVVDLAAVTAVQLDMLKRLADVYDADLDARSARAFATSVTTALAGNALGRVAASFVKLIPGLGTVAGGIASIVTTGASTYAVGNLVKRMFREGKSFDEVDAAALKEEAGRYYESGKEYARSIADKIKDARSRFGKGGQ